MNAFIEFLQEAPIAVLGDFEQEEPNMTRTEFVTNKDWIYLKDIKTKLGNLELRKHKTLNSFMLGKFSEDKERNFKIALLLKGQRDKKLERDLSSVSPKYKKLINVDLVYVDPDYRGMDLSTMMYKELVNNQGFVLMGDKYQFNGARKLWGKLSSDLIVDIIDLKTKTIIKQNVTLKQNTDMTDFDKEIWSLYPCASKHDIRPILTKTN